MDKIIELFSIRMESMCKEYIDKILTIPIWKLDAILPVELKNMERGYKHSYLIEKFKNSNPIYLKLKKDLDLLANNNIVLQDLQSLDLDPRYLESMGLQEIQIESYYRFVDEVKALF